MTCCWHAQPVEAADEAFWCQFWSETVTCVQDVFALIPAAEIRALREESPSNLATLCYKAVEKLVQAAETGCHSHKEEQTGSLSSLFLQPVLLLKCHILKHFTAPFRKSTVFLYLSSQFCITVYGYHECSRYCTGHIQVIFFQNIYTFGKG